MSFDTAHLLLFFMRLKPMLDKKIGTAALDLGNHFNPSALFWSRWLPSPRLLKPAGGILNGLPCSPRGSLFCGRPIVGAIG